MPEVLSMAPSKDNQTIVGLFDSSLLR